VEEVKQSLGVKVNDMDDIRRRLKKQGLEAGKLDVRGGVEEDEDHKHPVGVNLCGLDRVGNDMHERWGTWIS